MTDPAIIGRSGFGVIDYCRALCHGSAQTPEEGWGSSSTARWAGQRSGFADWFTVAP